MHPPVPGDVIRAVGYPGSHVDDGVLTVYPSESLTRVREVQIKTPLRIRPTSYVELDGEIRGGMSGGPCFDEAGRVVGICSKGWDFLDDEPDQTPISYMALIWPAMGRRIEHYQREPFPVWDLFRGGPAQAIGHDRIHVTSKGDVHIAKVTEELLLPFHWTFSADQLDASLHYCAENARASVRRGTRTPGRTRMQQAKRQPNSHVLAAVLRELDAAIRLALRAAVARTGGSIPFPTDWSAFETYCRTLSLRADVLDELTLLRFSWNGFHLFDIRTYASMGREGPLALPRVVQSETDRIVADVLEPCRQHGPQIALPEGLEPYYAAATRFASRIRNLSEQLPRP